MSLDPLTPLWHVDRLPEGRPIGGVEEARDWRRAESVLGGALLVGLAAGTMEMAVAYAKQREQFGKPIGSFQAVKHMCADMLVAAETARAAVHAAAVPATCPGWVTRRPGRHRRRDAGPGGDGRQAAGGRGGGQRPGRHPGPRGDGLHLGGAAPSLPDAGPGARQGFGTVAELAAAVVAEQNLHVPSDGRAHNDRPRTDPRRHGATVPEG